MRSAAPQCRSVTVHTFRGNRGDFGRRVRRALNDQKHGVGAGPSRLDCLLYIGHTGVETDADHTIYGFTPDFGTLPIWQGMQKLRNGDAFPGVVLDDTQVFADAKKLRLKVQTLQVILPEPAFQDFDRVLSSERKRCGFMYGFPNGDGECNCTTWLERLALPLLSGSMDEFTGLPGFRTFPRRRFGKCV
jgi:hypothetical protein